MMGLRFPTDYTGGVNQAVEREWIVCIASLEPHGARGWSRPAVHNAAAGGFGDSAAGCQSSYWIRRPKEHETVAPASRPAVAWTSRSTLVYPIIPDHGLSQVCLPIIESRLQ